MCGTDWNWNQMGIGPEEESCDKKVVAISNCAKEFTQAKKKLLEKKFDPKNLR